MESSDALKPEGEIVKPQADGTDKLLEDLNLAGYLPDNLLNEINKKSSTPSPPNRVQVGEKVWKKLGFKLAILAIIVRIVHIFKLGYFFGEVSILFITVAFTFIFFKLIVFFRLSSFHLHCS